MSGDDNDDGDDHPQRSRSLGGAGRPGDSERDDEGDGEGRAFDGREDAHDGDSAREDGSPGDEATGEPLSDLRRDVDERRERGSGAGESDDAFEELFAEMEVEDVDEDAVWEALAESADEPVVEPDAVTTDTNVAGGTDSDGDVTVVEKSLCHGCPHFAAPPETACTHDGTTIAAEVDTGHFRVVDCPIVAEREARDDPGDFSADRE